jgi:hypothetical protein
MIIISEFKQFIFVKVRGAISEGNVYRRFEFGKVGVSLLA